eukprot:10675328-Lingulodinium_polyedra.AAC.1
MACTVATLGLKRIVALAYWVHSQPQWQPLGMVGGRLGEISTWWETSDGLLARWRRTSPNSAQCIL